MNKKSFLLLFFLILVPSIYSKINSTKMLLYHSKKFIPIERWNDSSLKQIEVDTSDLQFFNDIIDKYIPKKFPIYKASANSLYGIIFINDKLYQIRISKDTIFISHGNKRHYFIDNKEDQESIELFLKKYRDKLNCHILK